MIILKDVILEALGDSAVPLSLWEIVERYPPEPRFARSYYNRLSNAMKQMEGREVMCLGYRGARKVWTLTSKPKYSCVQTLDPGIYTLEELRIISMTVQASHPRARFDSRINAFVEEVQ